MEVDKMDKPKSVYDAEQKLFKTCPKMADPDWWENGSDIELPPDPELDKIIAENAAKAKELANKE